MRAAEALYDYEDPETGRALLFLTCNPDDIGNIARIITDTLCLRDIRTLLQVMADDYPENSTLAACLALLEGAE